jgi:hypothetical protein
LHELTARVLTNARRVVLIEEICIDAGALVLSADEDAYKNAFVLVFRAWAKGIIKGTAAQVFDAAKSILEDYARCSEARGSVSSRPSWPLRLLIGKLVDPEHITETP